jgi:hypothetical protein
MFAKFDTEEAALQYLPVIQAHVDANYQDKSKPTIRKAVIPTYDGKWAIPLPETYPETSGEVVPDIDPPKVEMELP